MSVKSDVLTKLEENRGNYFSGEQLAEELQVSRSAVWKAMKQLEKEGYEILAVPNRGYCLPENIDVISEEGIRTFLPQEYQERKIVVYRETTSTNTLVKQAANDGAKEGLVIVAENQTAGRGRRGRGFVSVPGGNICMSLLLRPQLSAGDAVFITTAACVAVHRAIRSVTGIVTDIKWVNDLYYRGKKVCGILTEAVTDCETGRVDCVIPGIGINFNIAPEQFPEELREIAGALYENDRRIAVTRNQLVAQVIVQLDRIAGNLSDHSFLEEYREHSMLLGQNIWVMTQGEPVAAVARDIDENGGLVIEYEDGRRAVLNTGEVTVRVRNGETGPG